MFSSALRRLRRVRLLRPSASPASPSFIAALVGLLVLLPGEAAAQQGLPTDQTAPVVSLSPGTSTVSSASQAVTVTLSDDQSLSSATYHVTLNGADVTSSLPYTASSSKMGTASGTVTLVEGTNTLAVSIEDASGNVGNGSATYTLAYSRTVSVTPDNATQNAYVGMALTQVFTIQNTGTASATYALAAACTAPATGCSTGGVSSVTLAAGASTTVSVAYNSGSTTGTGHVTLTASYSGTGANDTDGGSVDVIVGAVPVYAVSVTPDAGLSSATTSQSGRTQAFTVTNTGNTSTTYTFTVACTAPVTGCTTPSALTLAAGATNTASVGYGTTATAGPGRIRLTATRSGYTTPVDSGTVDVAVGAPITRTVAAMPDGRPVTVGTSAAGVTQIFQIRNVGNAPTTLSGYNLAVVCTGVADPIVTGHPCTLSSPSSWLPGGQWAEVAVTYWTGATAGTGRIKVTATYPTDASITDSAWVDVTTVSGGVLPLQVSAADVNPRATRDRGSCMRVSVGVGESECGDLVYGAALPGIRVLGKGRAPMLVYSSQAAHPRPVVMANVTTPSGGTQPTSVSATLTLGGTSSSATWPGTSFPVASTRRISLGVDGINLGTGLYPYTLQVTATYATGTPQVTIVNDSLVVVSRTGSSFGAGWWVNGLEQLAVNPPAGTAPTTTGILWVGGDGSTRFYRPSGTSGLWLAEESNGTDSLVYTGSYYSRRLAGGGDVRFDAASGQQYQTVNRQGFTTGFGWNAAYTQLTSISLPSGNGFTPASSTGWTFYYPTTGTLDSVSTPGAVSGSRRVVRLQKVGLDVVRITGPDSLGVGLNYGAPATHLPNVVTSYNTAGTAVGQSTLGWDAAQTLIQVHHYAGGMTSTSADPVLAMLWPQSRGYMGATAVTVNGAYGIVDGPRTDATDVSTYSVDRYGAPWQTSDPRGNLHTVYRRDWRFPGAVTTSDQPAGGSTDGAFSARLVTTAQYDDRGRIATASTLAPLGVTGQDATTTYAYTDPINPYAATRITSPTGLVSAMGYDTLGRRIWQQQGPDGARRVDFRYNARSQVDTVWSAAAQARGEAPEVMEYASTSGLGNLSAVQSPLGIRTTYVDDAIGRDTAVLMPVDSARSGGVASSTILSQRQSTVYDAADRVTDTYTYGPAVEYERVSDQAPRTTLPFVLRVHNAYNTQGQLARVDRWSVPDSAGIGVDSTRWHYDPLGRKVAELAADGARDSAVYDPAGNVTRSINRNGESTYTTYDALNRPTKRVMFSDSAATSLVRDSSVFAYDGSGAMVRADNDVAWVRRHYYPGGGLQTDTLWVAGQLGFLSGQHVYVQGYTYDLEGRRRAHSVPSTVIPVANAKIQYGYDLVTGALDTITDPLGNQYRFVYLNDGQLASLNLPGSITESYAYDADGRMRQRTRGSLYSDALTYDLRGKVVDAHTLAEQVSLAYDGLGHLAWSHTHNVVAYRDNPDSEEEYTSDALGNNTTRRLTGLPSSVGLPTPGVPTAQVYQAGTGRHIGSAAPAPGYTSSDLADSRWEVFGYDAAGNLTGSSIQQGLTVLSGVMGGPGSMIFTTEHVDTLAGIVHDDSWRTWGPQDTVTVSSVEDPLAKAAAQLVNNQYRYRPDGKLVWFNRVADCLRFVTNGDCASQYPAYTSQSRTETYRYDALGRRVIVRTVTPTGSVLTGQGLCDDGLHRCDNTTRRTVWDGDQVLAEMRYPNAQAEQDSGLDSLNVAERARRDTIAETDEGHPYGGHNTSWWAPHGRVLYVHGGGMDQPLGLIRSDYSYDFADPVLIVPHANWRSAYETSTFADGSTSKCVTVWLPANEVLRRDATGHWTFPADAPDTTQVRCIERDLPGAYMGMTRLLKRQTVWGPISWIGSVVQDGQDASGLSYRRNRYYDPSTGRFTQEDPIGIAGGLNVYGFGGGDPVSYSDPYGLAPDGNGGNWSPVAHDRLIRHALEGRAPEADIAALQAASRAFDSGKDPEWGDTQTPGAAFMHAMRPDGWTARKAKSMTHSFVEANLSRARAAARAGNRSEALRILGVAMHPLMDSTSPMHTDEDGNPRIWRGIRDGVGHSPTDWMGSETSSDITAAIYAKNDALLLNSYNKVFR